MKKVYDLLSLYPLLLLTWGYEFPILTDVEYSFNVKCRRYEGRIRICLENDSYSILFLASNKEFAFLKPKEVLQVLLEELKDENKTNTFHI